MLDAALSYAKRGWHVFPVTHTKVPFSKTHGHKDATCNAEEVRALWRRFPQANVAIATGKRSGIFVLDVDVKDYKVGEESLEELERQFGELPDSVEAITASGGRHIYFRYPSEGEIYNSQSKVGKDLDIRGEGGYVVAPNSVIDGKAYSWELLHHPDEHKVVDAPQWLIDKARGNASAEVFHLPEGDIPQGVQDDTLFRFACSLKSQGFIEKMVKSALKQALKKCVQNPDKPFSDKDIHRWVKRAFGYKDKTAKKGKQEKESELDLALYLKKKHTLIFSEEGQFYRYLEGYYQKVSENSLVNVMTKEFGCLKNNIINLILRYIKAKSEVAVDVLNNDPYLNLKNGLFDIKTCVFTPHRSDVLSTIRLNVAYDPQADCPLWKESVKRIVQNQDNIELIQEFFGLCMTQETYDKALFITGEGSNGKSTLLDVLKGILGNDNTCEVQLEQLEKSHYVAQLHNKLLNISTEIGAKGTVCDDIFKKVVAHDYIMGDHKFGHPFSFRPACKLIFAANSMPRTNDKSKAFYRRMLIVSLSNEFTDKDGKHKYYRTLLEERNGIFNWMIEGLKRLKNRGYFAIGEHMTQSIEDYRVENNPILGFVEERCVLETHAITTKTLLFDAYKTFCIDCGFRFVNIRKFGKELKKGLPHQVNEGHDSTKENREWFGIRLRRR